MRQVLKNDFVKLSLFSLASLLVWNLNRPPRWPIFSATLIAITATSTAITIVLAYRAAKQQ